MDFLTDPDSIRYLNAALAAVALLAHGWRMVRLPVNDDLGERFWWGVMLAVTCYGSVEAARDPNTPGGIRVFLVLIVLVGLLRSMAWPPSKLARRH